MNLNNTKNCSITIDCLICGEPALSIDFPRNTYNTSSLPVKVCDKCKAAVMMVRNLKIINYYLDGSKEEKFPIEEYMEAHKND